MNEKTDEHLQQDTLYNYTMQFVIGAVGSAIVTMVASNVLGVSLIKIGAGLLALEESS
jgi:hypothetical protein